MKFDLLDQKIASAPAGASGVMDNNKRFGERLCA
jgi:hypothetical protein